MSKRMLVIAAAITTLSVITIFDGSGQNIDTGVSSPGLQSSPADVPEMINYQGVLTDPDGNPRIPPFR